MALQLETKKQRSEYQAAHMWMRYHFGKPQKCESCSTTEDRMYHWANVSGTYTRDRADWLRLCVPCHKGSDIKQLGGKIKAKTLKAQPSKRCPQCKVTYFKKPKFTKGQWASQVYCSRVCAGKANTAQYEANTRPTKHCELCSVIMVKEKYMSMAGWNKRRFCGRKCGSTVSASVRRGVPQSEAVIKKKSDSLRGYHASIK